jgi:two-component system sensor histidine kinase DegS
MMEHCPFSSPNQFVSEARLKVETCTAGLCNLLSAAQEEYENTLVELEDLATASIGRRDESLSTRVGHMKRSRELQDVAEQYDGAIIRLTETTSRLNEALDILDGRARASSSRQEREISLEAVAIQAQEEERYRLAREVHDGPAQILSNVALQLEYISKLATRDPARAKDEMETIQKDLRLAVDEVRRFMYDLRPPALAQQGVGAAVESHCQRLAHRFGMEISVDWRSSAVLPPSHDTAVFRIVQEALQNVVKHAQSTLVEVRSQDAEGYLRVRVRDNGKGFEPDRVRNLDPDHFGLAGMGARAQQIGAELEVSSIPDIGTTVNLKVPLVRNQLLG